MTYLCNECGTEFYHSKRSPDEKKCPECGSKSDENHIAQPFAVLGDYLRFYDPN